MLSNQTDSTSDLEIPDKFICPLTLELMHDPVMTRCGNSYERSAILKWVGSKNPHCPLTRRPLHLSNIVTNHQLRFKICQFQKDNNLDITLIMTSERNKFSGYCNLRPEKDLNKTERFNEDEEEIVQAPSPPQPPPQQGSRGSRFLRTFVRNRSGSGR
jgi:hypothetical protein